MKKHVALTCCLATLAFAANSQEKSAQQKSAQQNSAPQNSVEVMHFWTSAGEKDALNVIKAGLEKEGISWVDVSVEGGGGGNATTAVRNRVLSVRPPTSVLMMGYDLVDWGRTEILADLNDLAEREKWDEVVPRAVQKFSKYNGKWIAAPSNVHSINWVWANRSVLAKAGVLQEPKTWDEFITAAESVQRAGFIAVAYGGQAWQDATVFDGVALATGGADYFRKAFVDLDPKMLASPTTEKIFSRMSQLKKLIDKDAKNRDWNVATAMVIEGKAGFQIMGDWAKGEFVSAGKVPGKDFLCFPIPGSQQSVSFLSNQFAMFKVGADKAAAQRKLASVILKPEIQVAFNLKKGSIPARLDTPTAAFDACGRKAIEELIEADKRNALVGSLAHGHAVPDAIKGAFYDVIHKHMQGALDDKAAARELVTIGRLKSLHMHLSAADPSAPAPAVAVASAELIQ